LDDYIHTVAELMNDAKVRVR